jgi:apolipoprotein N-acyltransferase
LAAYVLATFLAFPHFVAGRVVDLGLVCAWLAPAALLLGLRGSSPAAAARNGFLAGLAAHAAVLHWIYVVTVVYGHAPVAAGVAAPVALASYVAAFTAAFAAGYAWLERRGVGGPLCAALLWTALDHLRSFALTGFPWATLGYAQHESVPLLGLTAWTGVYALSFTTVLGGAALAECLHPRTPRRLSPATAGAFLGAALLHGVGLLASPGDVGAGPTVRVAVLQGNIDQGVKWNPAWALRTLEIYENLSREAASEGARVIVWPETAAPGSVDTDPVLHERIAALARETGTALVVGGVGIEEVPEGMRFFDSAFLFDRSGRMTDRYDKAHLVPFGEYVPLRGLIGKLISGVATGIASADVTPGSAPRAVAVDASNRGQGVPNLTVGVPICYELLFPDLVRKFVGDGAAVLLAITNDAWYGWTGAPYQFLAITALRSAETRVWTARAANTGVSAFIDDRGRVRQQTPIFERGFLVADVPLAPAGRASFYVRHGDVFAWACWIGVLALSITGGIRSRNAR